jgi:hypothetical protein
LQAATISAISMVSKGVIDRPENAIQAGRIDPPPVGADDTPWHETRNDALS